MTVPLPDSTSWCARSLAVGSMVRIASPSSQSFGIPLFTLILLGANDRSMIMSLWVEVFFGRDMSGFM